MANIIIAKTKQVLKERSTFLIISVAGLVGLLAAFFVINSSILPHSTNYTLQEPDSLSRSKANLQLKVRRLHETVDYEIAKSDGTTMAMTKDEIFNKNPIFLFWAILNMVMVTIASGAAGIYFIQLKELIDKFSVKASDLWIVSLLTFAVVTVVVFVQVYLRGMYRIEDIFTDFNVLFSKGYEAVPDYISFFTIALTSPIIMTIFLISVVSLAMDNEEEKSLKKFRDINKTLMSSLQALSVIIVFAVLTSSALRLSIKNQVNIKETYFDVFPEGFSYVYGMLFSLFLAIIFIPVYIQLQNQKEELIEIHSKSGDKKDWIETLKKDGSIAENIKLILSMILPLLSSFLPDSLKLFK